MRYNVKDITIFFYLLKNVNGIGGGLKNYSKNKTTIEMKTILYILLYSPFIEWTTLLEWFNKLIKYKTDSYQFFIIF